MTTNLQQGTLLDVLKKKMRQTKEEMEKYKDECEEFQKRLQAELIRREEVSVLYWLPPPPFHLVVLTKNFLESDPYEGKATILVFEFSCGIL